MKLSIVTLNFKKPELTSNCLTSLYKQYEKEFVDNTFECVIVDNNSEDNSVQFLREIIKKNNYRNISVVPHNENKGFGAGNNVGAQAAKGKYILFLNNDTQVKDSGLKKMVNYMEQHMEVAILGGQIRNADGTLQASAGAFFTLWYVFLLLLGLQKYGLLDRNPKKIEKVDWVKGAVLMIRKEVFEKIRGFDENIFMYTEDMELCFRAKQQGFQAYFFPDVTVLHTEHGSSNRTFAIIHIYEGLRYFYKKYKSPFEQNMLQLFLIIKAQLAITIGKFTKNTYLITTYEEALATIR